MPRIPMTASAALLVAAPMLLTGCGPSDGTSPPTTPAPATAPSTAASDPSAGPAEQAKAAAIQTVIDYNQMVAVDLFSGRATLNDLTDVTTSGQLDGQQRYSQRVLAQGWTAKPDQTPKMASIKVISATPKSDPTKVVIRYCVDNTGIKYTREVDGKKKTVYGIREGADKTVEKTPWGWRITSSSDVTRC